MWAPRNSIISAFFRRCSGRCVRLAQIKGIGSGDARKRKPLPVVMPPFWGGRPKTGRQTGTRPQADFWHSRQAVRSRPRALSAARRYGLENHFRDLGFDTGSFGGREDLKLASSPGILGFPRNCGNHNLTAAKHRVTLRFRSHLGRVWQAFLARHGTSEVGGDPGCVVAALVALIRVIFFSEVPLCPSYVGPDEALPSSNCWW
jgi:hypothetical protein